MEIHLLPTYWKLLALLRGQNSTAITLSAGGSNGLNSSIHILTTALYTEYGSVLLDKASASSMVTPKNLQLLRDLCANIDAVWFGHSPPSPPRSLLSCDSNIYIYIDSSLLHALLLFTCTHPYLHAAQAMFSLNSDRCQLSSKSFSLRLLWSTITVVTVVSRFLLLLLLPALFVHVVLLRLLYFALRLREKKSKTKIVPLCAFVVYSKCVLNAMEGERERERE